jgi:predicted PurR-regulated permease PerM
MVQPKGASYTLNGHEVEWQNWKFHFRMDMRRGLVVSRVRYVDAGKERSVMYQGSLSELFVPYMDPADPWNYQGYFDLGTYPFAFGGIASSLEPGVEWLERRGLNRQRSVLLAFAVFMLALSALGWWMVVKLDDPAKNLAHRVPVYYAKAQQAMLDFGAKIEKDYGVTLPFHAATSAEPAAPVNPEAAAKSGGDSVDFDLQALMRGDWVKTTLPKLPGMAWTFIKSSVGGFLGVFGFLLSFIIVPLYLYYFLIESAKIQESWSDYLPLRASAFKDEVVSCLSEINSYLVAFFRGQLFVSVINGIATGIGLVIVGLDFGLLIGLALCVAGIIPYLGIALCWIPAVIIGAVQGGSVLIPGDPWWVMPLVVTSVFVLVQQIDALFITPRIVGEAVGLHPMTVIASVLIWALLLGGLLGAILAVPLTASVKVLFQRYIWRARIAPQTIGGAKRGEAPPC